MQRKNGFSLIEVIIALFLVSLTALGGASLGVQAIKTSNKSKVLLLALEIESTVLDLSANNSYYIGNLSQRLREGVLPLPELKLMKDGIEYVIPAVGSNTIYFNLKGEAVQNTDPNWVLSLELAYRKTREGSAQYFPEYAFAYSIGISDRAKESISTVFRNRGQKAGGQFQANDFILPLATAVYTGPLSGSSDPGRCQISGEQVPEETVIGIKSINLLSMVPQCVLAPEVAPCAANQISTGTIINNEDLDEPDNGNSTYSLNCVSKRSCGCGHISNVNWVVTAYRPAAMYFALPGGDCGRCELAFRKKVDSRMNPLSNLSLNTVYPACPSQNYLATGFSCSVRFSANVISRDELLAEEGIDPLNIPPGYDDCSAAGGEQNAVGTISATSNGGVSCQAIEPATDRCIRSWSSRVDFSFPAKACVLQGGEQSARQ